ncbi:MAG: hypothetical protein JWM53_5960 [bacterium]|nr:hypothetical protein [bacterium]
MGGRCVAICVVVGLLMATNSRAAYAADPLDENQTVAIERAQRLRRVGMGLTLSAIGLEVATLALWGGVIAIVGSRSSEYGPDPPAYWPVLGLAVGTTVAVPLLLSAGVPLWSIGSRRINELKRRHVTISPGGTIRF